MKRVMVLSYHFPPDGEIGAVRPAEWFVHLPNCGWEPIALTILPKYYSVLDEDRYAYSPWRMCRTRQLGNVNNLYRRLKAGITKINGKGAAFQPPVLKSTFKSLKNNESLRSRLVRYYNSLVVYLPDEYGWTFPALMAGLKVILVEKPDVIVSTGPPHTSHLVALILKLLTGTPWIADFRDPWEVEIKSSNRRSRLSDAIERLTERLIVKNSNYVISVTSSMTGRLRRYYPEWSDKCRTITNGYDSTRLGPLLQERQYTTFTITYIGSFYFGRDPEIFLRALNQILQDGQIPEPDICVKFIGDCRYSDGKSVAQIIRKLGMQEIVHILDRVSQNEALLEVARSHVAVLLAPDQPLQIPAKVFEYIGMKKPILALCGEGATRELLEEYPLAKVVYPGDLAGVRSAIMAFYRETRSTDLGRMLMGCDFERYERRSTTRELVTLLEGCLKANVGTCERM